MRYFSYFFGNVHRGESYTTDKGTLVNKLYGIGKSYRGKVSTVSERLVSNTTDRKIHIRLRNLDDSPFGSTYSGDYVIFLVLTDFVRQLLLSGH